jgi:hypothetical protein
MGVGEIVGVSIGGVAVNVGDTLSVFVRDKDGGTVCEKGVWHAFSNSAINKKRGRKWIL